MAVRWTGETPPFSAVDFTGFGVGDYVIVSKLGGDTVNPANVGQYVIVGIDIPHSTVWF